MKTFFSIVYIKPNNYSEERIAVGILGAEENVPFFYVNEKKLNFGLRLLHSTLRSPIKKGFKYLDFDINKYREGRETLPLFDEPLSIKYLKDLVKSKRGKIDYSPVFERDETIELDKLVKKYIGVSPSDPKENRPSQFKEWQAFLKGIKIKNFTKNYTISESIHPLLLTDFKVDLYREKGSVTLFKFLDLSRSSAYLQAQLVLYKNVIEGMSSWSSENGLGKGRYYLVVKKDDSRNKLSLSDIQAKAFEIINISQVKDKM